MTIGTETYQKYISLRICVPDNWSIVLNCNAWNTLVNNLRDKKR